MLWLANRRDPRSQAIATTESIVLPLALLGAFSMKNLNDLVGRDRAAACPADIAISAIRGDGK
jgi:hypothetical protein